MVGEHFTASGFSASNNAHRGTGLDAAGGVIGADGVQAAVVVGEEIALVQRP